MTGTSITSRDFQNNVGRYQDAAQAAPVTITKHGRPHTVLVSAAFFETVVKGRVARRAADLDEATLKAIEEAEVPDDYLGLDQKLGLK